MKIEILKAKIKLVKKIVEEENNLKLEINDNELANVLKNKADEFITSSDLQIGDSKNIIFYEIVKNSGEFVKKLESYIDVKNYTAFQIIIIVHSIKDKIHISDLLEKELKKIRKEKKISSSLIKFEVYFIGIHNKRDIHIAIDSAIMINEYTHKKNIVSGKVYNAKLSDLVQLYNYLGDELFKDNVREKIDNVLDVDTEIINTLKNQPEDFWFFNNGVTLLIESGCIQQKHEYQLDIDISHYNNVSVINGAQTISIAAQYYLGLFEKLEDNTITQKEREELEANKNEVLETRVLLRVIEKDSNRDELKDFYKNISIALNRQKAINDVDIRYMDCLIEDINCLSENKKDPFFQIMKRGENNRTNKNKYKLDDFVKIVAIYLLQEPGSARSSKGKYFKMDAQWKKFSISEEGLDEKLFLRKYKPFIVVKKLFDKLNKHMSERAKVETDLSIQNIYKYGTEFLTAYIIWATNNNQDQDFSKFPNNLNWNEQIISIIEGKFVKEVMSYFDQIVIDSNLFKKDKAYIQLRENLFISQNLNSDIQKLFY